MTFCVGFFDARALVAKGQSNNFKLPKKLNGSLQIRQIAINGNVKWVNLNV